MAWPVIMIPSLPWALPGGSRRRWAMAAALALVALLALPALPVAAAGAPVVAAPVASQPRPTPTGAPHPAGGTGLPGQSPATEPYADGAAFALHAWQTSRAAARSTGTAVVAAPPALPNPSAPLVGGNGTVAGRVYDYTHGRPVANATVTISPTGLTICSTGTCGVGTTDTTGRFSVPAPVGTVVVSFTAGFYISNRTWATVSANATTDLGVLYLIHDGYATGILEDNMPSPLPIAGAALSATSRDGTTSTFPSVVSAANGSFTLPVPPLPSIVTITSPGNPTRYLENTTYVNVTPYGTVDLGVVHLEGGVPVTATFVDRITGLPVSNQTPAQLTVCSRRAGFCLAPVIAENGSRPTGYALPGATSIRAYAIGYILNETPVEDIPNTHAVVDLGTIYLTPVSLVEISTNVTGGPPPATPWSVGSVLVVACSLDDEQVTFQIATGSELLASPCTPRGVQFSFVPSNTYAVGTTALIVAPPLRDALYLENVSTFPYATNTLSSLTPLWPSAYDNTTWINATPGRITLAGSVDLTPGAMISGNISIPPELIGALITVTVCSTDVSTLCDAAARGPYSGEPAGCPTNPSSFCVPSPPGPVVLTVSGPSVPSNQTWLEVPRGCCSQDGHPIDVGWINLTNPLGVGEVNGTIVAQTGPPGSPTTLLPGALLTIEACSVAPPPVGLPPPGCTDGVVDNRTGAFNFSVPLGWDRVIVSATGYQTNETWVDVTGSNTTGVIELTPDAVLVGTVRDAAGGPIYSATVMPCLAAAVTQCYGAFVTNSFGQFNGSLRGGPLPWGTYEVSVQASGFAPNWIWTNTTPGAVTFLPPIVLYPVGSGTPGARSPTRAAVTNASVGAWVEGRLVDSRTGYGVPDALINECPLTGGGCLNSVALTTAGGTFNISLILGLYYVTFSVINYPATQVYVNATGVTHVDLGAIPIAPDPWVAGRVAILPWASLNASVGLGAPVQVEGCDNNLSRCDLTGPTASDGSFNVSVPSGTYSTLFLVGRGIQGFGSTGRGFDTVLYPLNVTTAYIDLPSTGPRAPGVSIYGTVVGTVADGSTWSSALGRATQPCGFCNVILTVTNSSQASYLNFQLGGGGDYTAFVPDDGTSVVIAGQASSFWPDDVRVAGAVAPAAVRSAPTSTPIHYGWVSLRLLGVGGVPVPYAFVTSAAPDPANSTVWYSQSLARGDGFVNVTAGFGSSVVVAIFVPGYFQKNLTLTVAPSRTTALGNVSLTGGAPPTVLWVNSTAQNVVGIPPLSTVVDAVTQAPIPNVYVEAVGASGGSSGTTITNGLGQFLFYAAPAPATVVQMSLPGYDSLDLYYNTSGLHQLTVNRSAMVGNGVVAGQVVAMPGSRPVYDALVEVCPFGNACNNFGYTNATGVFWVMAPRGFDTVTIVDAAYLTNATVNLNVGPDSWQWVGTLPVYAFAGIVGTVRAIPSGLPIPGANVSVCSPFGNPTGPCNYWVPTDANGSFFTPAPPGNYVLSFSAPGYNTSYLPLALLPGENLSVGNIFLFADGSILGTVVSAISGAPVPTATLIACATYRIGDCSAYTNVTSAGAFLVVSPPGPVRLTASAPGYFDNFSQVYVPSGGDLILPPIALAPIAADIPESVAGVVTDARDATPIAGAFVGALSGSVAVASTATNAAGAFRLPLPWGTYTIVAGSAGFVPSRVTLAVHANLTGLAFALAVRTYTVGGSVVDAASGAPIGGVTLAAAGVTSTSAANGSYALALPNGSYSVTATPPNASAGVDYAPLTFSVVVAAADVVRNVQLRIVAATLLGEVVDALSGLPVAGASVAAYAGTAATAVAVTTASSTGSFGLALAPGTYTVTASASGYADGSVSVTVPAAGGPVVVALEPLGATAAGGSTISPLLLAAVAGVGVVAVVAAIVLYRRRPPPPAPLPRWTLEDLEEHAVE